jgi:hypothetical protein
METPKLAEKKERHKWLSASPLHMRIYRETSIDSGASIVIVRYVFLGYLDMHYLSMKGCVDDDESAGD